MHFPKCTRMSTKEYPEGYRKREIRLLLLPFCIGSVCAREENVTPSTRRHMTLVTIGR